MNNCYAGDGTSGSVSGDANENIVSRNSQCNVRSTHMIVVVIPGAIEVVEAGAGPGTEETGTPLDIATGYEVTIVCTGQFVTSGGQSVTVRVLVV